MKNQSEVEHRIKIFEGLLFEETLMKGNINNPKDTKRNKEADIRIERLQSIIENLQWVLK